MSPPFFFFFLFLSVFSFFLFFFFSVFSFFLFFFFFFLAFFVLCVLVFLLGLRPLLSSHSLSLSTSSGACIFESVGVLVAESTRVEVRVRFVVALLLRHISRFVCSHVHSWFGILFRLLFRLGRSIAAFGALIAFFVQCCTGFPEE